MWILPTRGRPELCQEVLDHCVAAKMTEPGVVYVDGRVDDYPNLKLPDNWSKLIGYKDLTPAREWWYQTHPNQKYYAQLCDDMFPHTEYFDQKLVEVAGDWGFIQCWDKDPIGGGHYLEFTPPVVWGGELVRCAGFWTQYAPGIRQGEVDVAWQQILDRVGGLHYKDKNVIIHHKNWRTNARPKDETDNWERDGVEYIKNDRQLFKDWCEKGGPTEISDKILRAWPGATRKPVRDIG